MDVAAFLHVFPENIFYFDSSFRPVPLQQEFYGVKD
jgi:pre-mRNA-splicing helicase BRR2